MGTSVKTDPGYGVSGPRGCSASLRCRGVAVYCGTLEARRPDFGWGRGPVAELASAPPDTGVCAARGGRIFVRRKPTIPARGVSPFYMMERGV